MTSRFFLFLIALTGFLTTIAQSDSRQDPQQAVYALLERLLPGRSGGFALRILPRPPKADTTDISEDFVEIYTSGHQTHIDGSNPVAIAYGLHYYLRTYCHASISWCGDKLDMPAVLPALPAKIILRATFPDRLYFNYCTFSYSMAFWDWKRWEREIDWMALHGIQLPLSLVGQEAVWQNTLQAIGLDDSTIRSFIPGPSYNAWWLMGNLEGWGGPVSQKWIDDQRVLQQKILGRMRDLGMQPILQGFYGMVPNAFRSAFPKALIHDPGKWLGFQRPAFLVPTDTLFGKIAAIYYREQKRLYGRTFYFQGDPFHEGGVSKGVDVTASAHGIYTAMAQAEPNATWVLQAWQNNPLPALLQGIPPGKALVTDLFAEARPQWGGVPSLWQRKEGFLGHHWLWGEIPNFGGRTGMTAKLDRTNRDIMAAFHDPAGHDLSGIAAAPESIGQDPVLYDLLFDMAWQKDTIDMDSWLKRYIDSRYGWTNEHAIQAWQLLRNTVYHSTYEQGDPPLESILCTRPGWNKTTTSTWGYGTVDYDTKELVRAWSLLISAGERADKPAGQKVIPAGRHAGTFSEGYKYDLVNLTRQVLDNYGREIYARMQRAYTGKDTTAFNALSATFLQLIRDQDRLLGTRQEYLLGGWLAMAKNRATTPQEAASYEWNARCLITTWTHELNDVNDYSYREWNGLLRDYYLPRWEMYIQYCKKQLAGIPVVLPDFFAFESSWTHRTNVYTDKPAGGELKMVKELYGAYYDRCMGIR